MSEIHELQVTHSIINYYLFRDIKSVVVTVCKDIRKTPILTKKPEAASHIDSTSIR